MFDSNKAGCRPRRSRESAAGAPPPTAPVLRARVPVRSLTSRRLSVLDWERVVEQLRQESSCYDRRRGPAELPPLVARARPPREAEHHQVPRNVAKRRQRPPLLGLAREGPNGRRRTVKTETEWRRPSRLRRHRNLRTGQPIRRQVRPRRPRPRLNSPTGFHDRGQPEIPIAMLFPFPC